jgi:hypothetical protein
MTAGSLSLARAHRMNPNNARTLFNMLEKVTTKNNLSDTTGNIFKIVESSVETNNRPDSENQKRVLKMFKM